MDTIPSSEFRKTYPKLKEPVIVSVLGYAIGVWMPAPPISNPDAVEAFKEITSGNAVGLIEVGTGGQPTAQQRRDAILRRINKG